MYNDNIEEKKEQVTNIITNLAENNPHLTSEQISRAIAIYGVDPRSIEEITAELQAYSNQVAAAANQNSMGQPTEFLEDPIPADLLEDSSLMVTETAEPELIEPVVEEQYFVSSPETENENELNNMFATPAAEPVEDTLEQPKQLVKTAETIVEDDGGYGNVGALLTITILMSITTIVIAIFTLIAN